MKIKINKNTWGPLYLKLSPEVIGVCVKHSTKFDEIYNVQEMNFFTTDVEESNEDGRRNSETSNSRKSMVHREEWCSNPFYEGFEVADSLRVYLKRKKPQTMGYFAGTH